MRHDPELIGPLASTCSQFVTVTLLEDSLTAITSLPLGLITQIDSNLELHRMPPLTMCGISSPLPLECVARVNSSI